MEDMKYLYLTDTCRLCRLNLTEFERNKDDPPSFEIVFDFFEANLSLGMGLFTLDDNDSGSDPAVYVVGGEKTRFIPESFCSWDYSHPSDMQPLDTSYGDGGIGRKVYRLEPNSSTTTNNNNKKTGENAQKVVAVESSTIPDMISPKPNALTAKIDGKVYVLANTPYFYEEEFPSTGPSPPPTFEVYDPVTNSWEALENCPFDPSFIVPNALFVLNHFILVRNMNDFYIYDVDARVWSDGNTDLVQRHFSSFSSADDPVPHPYLFGTVATYEDLTIAYTGAVHGVVVYFPAYNVGPKHQSLGGLDLPFEIDDKYRYDVDCFYDPRTSDERIGNIFHLGGGMMCFFCAVCDDYTHVIVTLFQLKLQRSGMHYCSASAVVLCSHSYHLHELLGYTRQLFVMGELFDIHKFQDDVRNASSKRQREPQLEVLDVDASSKRIQTDSHCHFPAQTSISIQSSSSSPKMTDSAMDDRLATTQTFGTDPAVAGCQL